VTAEPQPTRPLRADAERNRQRILDAAAELFAERGLGVSLDEVAARAGVGVGTVYRRFANRDELLDAIMEARAKELLDMAEEARANPDPWEGLKHLIERRAEFQGRNRAFKQLIFSDVFERDWVERVRRAVHSATAELVERAQAQGKVRSDVTAIDVQLITLMLASTIEFTRGVDERVWRRLLTIVFDGLTEDRPDPSEFDAPPFGPKQLKEAMRRAAGQLGASP